MKINTKILFLTLSIVMTCIIWANSFLPARISLEQSGFITGLFQDILKIFSIQIKEEILSFYVRKFAHFGQFYILGLLYFKTIMYRVNKHLKIAFYTLGLGLLVAVIDESIQLFSEGRVFSIIDIGIDFFGVLMSVLCMLTLYLTSPNLSKK